MRKTQYIEAEQGVLGAVLMDNSLASGIDLSPSDFSVQTNSQIYDAITNLINQNQAADIITVSTYLEETLGHVEMNYIGELAELGLSGRVHIKQYSALVKRGSRLRAAQSIAEQLRYEIEHGEDDDFADRAIQALMNLDQGNQTYEATLKQSLTKALERIDEKFNNPGLPGLTTGIEDLDKALGGFRDQKLYVFAGRPGKGKSALMMNFVNTMIRHKVPSVVFSLEMEREELADRLIAINGSINSHKLSTAQFAEEDWAKLTASVSSLKQGDLRIVDEPNMPIIPMMRAARRAKQRDGAKIAFVDYIQIVRGTNSQQRTLERITEVTQLLKQMARELKIPVIALAQLKREADDLTSPAGMNYLADASAIEKDADYIGTLYASDEMEKDGRLLIHTCKNRGGPKGDIMTRYERQYYRISEFGSVKDYA